MSAHIPINEEMIQDQNQLVDYMLQGCKSKDEWVIGTEHEKFLWSTALKKRPDYHGPQGVFALLSAFENDGWLAHREGHDIVALTHNGASITLEPGGQLELSGAPLKSLHAMSHEMDTHIQAVRKHAEPLNLICSGLGSDAIPPALSPRMPKARYDVMRRYLGSKGELALHMMHNTATVQCNLDFASAEDAMQKLRVSLYIQPIVMAIFANSFVLDQQLQSGTCARSRIWLATDNDRYLYPAHFLDPKASIEDYVEWAIQVPMFFIARDGKYLDCSGVPFKQFMQQGWQGHQANLGDFALHLSTLFPDARLKQHLEVRAADMSTLAYAKALSALHVGLLYDQDNLDHLSERFTTIDATQLWQARSQVDEKGLQTMLADQSFQQWGEELLRLAQTGLQRYETGTDVYLDPVLEQVQAGLAPADHHRSHWDGHLHNLMVSCRL